MRNRKSEEEERLNNVKTELTRFIATRRNGPTYYERFDNFLRFFGLGPKFSIIEKTSAANKLLGLLRGEQQGKLTE